MNEMRKLMEIANQDLQENINDRSPTEVDIFRNELLSRIDEIEKEYQNSGSFAWVKGFKSALDKIRQGLY